ncbi:ABC transporter substrate-binding protein [Clostridium amazonitimonense]|uniref:ABC transporter substrate-binding protein n=1 Tax=Clostridium amazonitimonense TaxID=1499689 RepID=UPI000509FEBC|nr:ABC transporter substrate-binding protein [Clostridium amazonitimonense]
MKKKVIASLILTTLVSSLFVGCSKEKDTSASAGGKTTEIVFWHSMGGVGGESINKMVEDFNNSQSNIKVTAQYQGSYDDAINKMKSAQQGNAGPDVMQLYDIGTRWMIDSTYATPIQKFIDAEKFDISSLEPNLLGYYTVNDKLYSMPFNSSTPILYYNKDAFKEAGLDPEKPPKTFDEIKEISQKLTKKDADGKVSQYGYSMAIYGWFVEQLIAKQGQTYANNENGRKDKATNVDFDKNGSAVKVFKLWKELFDSGNFGNFGRKTSDTQNAFIAGKTAIMIDSTSVLNSVMKGINGNFEVGTAFLPKLSEGDKGGVSIGGGSLWIMDKKDEAKQKSAFEFVKFMVSSEQQVFWNKSTGYFPVTKKAYDSAELKETLTKYPQFQTAIDQLHESPLESRGALLGVFPEARQTIETNIESMLQGKMSPEEAVENSAKTINAAIEKYNKTNK